MGLPPAGMSTPEEREGKAAVAAEKGDGASSIVGESRNVEDILSVTTAEAGGGGGLRLRAETSRAPVALEPAGERAWRAGDGDEAYELVFDGKNSIQVKKGETSFTAHRVAQSKSLPGRWERSGKVVVIEAGADGRGWEMRAEGKALMLLRRGLMSWEAREQEGVEPAYVLEHQEGSDEISVRRPEGSSSIVLQRAGAPSGDAKAEALLPTDDRRNGGRAASHSRSRSRSSRRGRSRSGRREDADLEEFVRRNGLAKRTEDALRGLSPNELRDVMQPMQGSVRDPDAVVMSRITRAKADSSRADNRSRSRGGRGGEGGDTLEEFIEKNKLSKRSEEELRRCSPEELRNIMGTDGGRNGFILLGVVRDPDAVVLSRINRVKGGGGPPPRAPPPRRDRRDSRSRSRSPYYSDYSDYSPIYSPSPVRKKRRRTRRHEKKAKKSRKSKKDSRHGKEKRRRRR